MSYVEVLNELRTMGLENFNYIEYLRLVFSNWITGSMFVACTAIFVICIAVLAYQIWFFKKAIKEELL